MNLQSFAAYHSLGGSYPQPDWLVNPRDAVEGGAAHPLHSMWRPAAGASS